METGGADGSEMGSVMAGEENKYQGPVSMPASLRTFGTRRRATNTHESMS